MVLVANKKNQDQMKDDLSLFLHGHADVFTAWLQDILKKLKQVSKPKPGIKFLKSYLICSHVGDIMRRIS